MLWNCVVWGIVARCLVLYHKFGNKWESVVWVRILVLYPISV
jgi:hypothetical protein